MPGRDFSGIAGEWLAAGTSPDLPCVAISHAARPNQQIVATTLGRLGSIEAGPAPVLLVAGWVFRDVRVDAPEFQPVLSSLVESALPLEA